jgi:hypothetical protein
MNEATSSSATPRTKATALTTGISDAMVNLLEKTQCHQD